MTSFLLAAAAVLNVQDRVLQAGHQLAPTTFKLVDYYEGILTGIQRLGVFEAKWKLLLHWEHTLPILLTYIRSYLKQIPITSLGCLNQYGLFGLKGDLRERSFITSST